MNDSIDDVRLEDIEDYCSGSWDDSDDECQTMNVRTLIVAEYHQTPAVKVFALNEHVEITDNLKDLYPKWGGAGIEEKDNCISENLCFENDWKHPFRMYVDHYENGVLLKHTDVTDKLS